MSDLATRLALSVSSLMERFKLQPDGPYAGLGLSETAIVSRIAASAHPPVQGEIGQMLGLPKTTMASAVRRLEERELLTRAPSAEDARARILALTPSGIALADSLRQTQLRASQVMLDALPANDREKLVSMLERIAGTDLQHS